MRLLSAVPRGVLSFLIGAPALVLFILAGLMLAAGLLGLFVADAVLR